MSRADDLVHEYRQRWMENQAYSFDREVDHCESPIEAVFIAFAMSYLFQPIGEQDRWMRAVDLLEASGLRVESDWHVLGSCSLDERLVLTSQPWLVLDDRKMRLDFALVTSPEFDGGCKLAIELDGHDFHERTPEQAERDKSRDRLLQQHGWQALRFTGREVLRDPLVCLEQCLAFGRARIAAAAKVAR